MEVINAASEQKPAQPQPPAEKAAAAPIAPAEIDAARQQRAREYARIKHWLTLADLALGGVALVVLLATGIATSLRDALAGTGTWQPIAGWAPLQVALFFLALMVAYQILDAPLSYYSGFVLPRRYGLSRQSLGSWLGDQAKGLALGLVFEIGAVEMLYLLLATQPNTWWLWAAGALLLFSVVLANLAPVLILPLFFKLTPLQEEELSKRLLALAERANTRVMGLGNTRRIVLGDTLLGSYTHDEIEVVLAHELGHHVHRDIWKLIVTQTVLALGGLFVVNLVLHGIVQGSATYRGLSDVATMPLVAAALGLFGLVVMPLGNSFSRRVERQADEYALQSTRMPDAFISSMTRLANQNLAELDPGPVIEFLLYDHPAIGKRLKHAEQFKAREMHANAS
jgi:STE24 endopeptidase